MKAKRQLKRLRAEVRDLQAQVEYLYESGASNDAKMSRHGAGMVEVAQAVEQVAADGNATRADLIVLAARVTELEADSSDGLDHSPQLTEAQYLAGEGA